MRRLLFLGVALTLGGIAACKTTDPAPPLARSEAARAEAAPAVPAIHLSNAAPSVDSLVDQFLTALAANDLDALERLRVTEQEYRTFIMPGSVEPGQSPKDYPPTPSVYYWGMMNTKSIYSLHSILGTFGGHTYRRKGLTFAKGIHKYAWYTAHQKLVLTLEDESGQEAELGTGSIAEVNGQYKFVSFRP